MKLEKRYFSESQALLQKSREEVRQELAQLSPEARKKHDEQVQAAFQVLMDKIDQNIGGIAYVYNPNRYKFFQHLVKLAQYVAEALGMDLTATYDGGHHGKITLETDMLLIQSDMMNPCFHDFLTLIYHANEITFSVNDGLLHILILYDICQEKKSRDDPLGHLTICENPDLVGTTAHSLDIQRKR